LTALADLLKPLADHEAQDELDEKDREILQKAAIIPTPLKRNRLGKRKAPKHIVFVNNDQEGSSYGEG
jgi:hypothetical protein